MIKIVLADDQVLFRSTLEESMSSDSEITICASVSNGKEALEACIRHKPDIAILDIRMPVKTGVEALAEIKEKMPQIKVILLTTFEDQESIIQAYRLKADGYLLKNIHSDALKTAIKCLYNNISVCDSSVQVFLSEYLCDQRNKKSNERFVFGDFIFDTTDLEIIRRIAEGKTNKEIGADLNFTEGTIKNRVSGILSQTGLMDRTKIAIFALKNSII